MDEMCQNLGMTGVWKNAGRPIWGMLKKAASGVLALLPCSRTESTLRASKGLRSCWADFFEHSLSLMLVIFPGAFMGHGHEIFNRPIWSVEAFYNRWRAREWCVSKSATVVVQVAIKNRSI